MAMTLRHALEALRILCHFQLDENRPFKDETATHQTQDWCVEELKKHELKRCRATEPARKREFAADVACILAFALNAGHYLGRHYTTTAMCVDVMFGWAARDLHSLDMENDFRETAKEDREIVFGTEEFVEAYEQDNGMASSFSHHTLVALARWLWSQDLLYPPRDDDRTKVEWREGTNPRIYGDDKDWY